MFMVSPGQHFMMKLLYNGSRLSHHSLPLQFRITFKQISCDSNLSHTVQFSSGFQVVYKLVLHETEALWLFLWQCGPHSLFFLCVPG